VQAHAAHDRQAEQPHGGVRLPLFAGLGNLEAVCEYVSVWVCEWPTCTFTYPHTHIFSIMTTPSKPSSLVALRYSNYRLLWIGQLISFSGSMMQNAAILWHVSLLVPENQKGLALGLVGLVRVLPIIIFSLIGGVVADAVDRVRLLLITQITM